MIEALRDDCAFTLDGADVECTVGIKQGCNPAPALFPLIMRAATTTAPWPEEVNPLTSHTTATACCTAAKARLRHHLHHRIRRC